MLREGQLLELFGKQGFEYDIAKASEPVTDKLTDPIKSCCGMKTKASEDNTNNLARAN